MNTITFSVVGEPVPKARARAFIRGGAIGHYTPDKTRAYEAAVQAAARAAMGKTPPLTGAVRLSLWFFLPIPASYSEKRKAELLKGTAAMGSASHTKRPDLDNLIKSVSDALNGVVFGDDCQIVQVEAIKRYGLTPSVNIEVIEL